MINIKSKKIILHCILPLVIGCFIYFFEKSSPILTGVANYLPDGLWSYSLVSLLLLVWDSKVPYIWAIAIIIMFFGTEYLQYYGIIPGTGDIYDLVIYILFGLFSQLMLCNSFFLKTQK